MFARCSLSSMVASCSFRLSASPVVFANVFFSASTWCAPTLNVSTNHPRTHTMAQTSSSMAFSSSRSLVIRPCAWSSWDVACTTSTINVSLTVHSFVLVCFGSHRAQFIFQRLDAVQHCRVLPKPRSVFTSTSGVVEDNNNHSPQVLP